MRNLLKRILDRLFSHRSTCHVCYEEFEDFEEGSPETFCCDYFPGMPAICFRCELLREQGLDNEKIRVALGMGCYEPELLAHQIDGLMLKLCPNIPKDMTVNICATEDGVSFSLTSEKGGQDETATLAELMSRALKYSEEL